MSWFSKLRGRASHVDTSRQQDPTIRWTVSVSNFEKAYQKATNDDWHEALRLMREILPLPTEGEAAVEWLKARVGVGSGMLSKVMEFKGHCLGRVIESRVHSLHSGNIAFGDRTEVSGDSELAELASEARIHIILTGDFFSDDPDNLARAALLALQLGAFDEAGPLVLRALKLDPNHEGATAVMQQLKQVKQRWRS